MHYDISFPNLGIYLDHVGKNISIFGFEIAYYGIIIGCAILIGFLIATSEAKRTRQNPEDYLDMGIVGVIAGIVGARAYYVIFSWDMYKDNLLHIFNLREGGLAIYGGVIGAVIAVFVLARIKRLSPFQILDTIAMALLNGQMLGRWGNFFNREAFGEYTDSLFAMRLPLDAVRSGDVTELMREHIERIDGVSYIQVHPTFLYESVWCCVLLIILALYRKHKKYEGELFLLYIFGYGLGRVWIEGLRTDQLLLPGIGLPVSQLLAGCIVIVAGGALLYLRKNHRRMPLMKPQKQYEPMPDKIVGKKPPKNKDKIFKFKDK
ncbi:prolipoprotein diacylglyceryl transferase [Mediterraneibacter glycyrrhizinilyticus]|uniref:prolipoprotein diacylglyceryl transferase n=1 Tax=Mediterraneibacter glycyrrhizinilyticus TaxID=342942 RepID=UPI001961227F|nr:prolipoprotein diacylglyceryl transferase [Mediterraneibacter glycyrrhizinilyticus]MBM6751334.1 prolipoprotein diacylglyceryl transferase [Mediterraneibacter glycyrrhizinilyticus]HJC90769.1 prolipoprotein diacylglyceryl transferase [Candidatus Mediterraneibacter excrementigallinarum]